MFFKIIIWYFQRKCFPPSLFCQEKPLVAPPLTDKFIGYFSALPLFLATPDLLIQKALCMFKVSNFSQFSLLFNKHFGLWDLSPYKFTIYHPLFRAFIKFKVLIPPRRVFYCSYQHYHSQRAASSISKFYTPERINYHGSKNLWIEENGNTKHAFMMKGNITQICNVLFLFKSIKMSKNAPNLE